MATTACASSRPGDAIQATQQSDMAEARLGSHRSRLPVEMFRYGIAPQGERRSEMMLRLPEQSPLAVEPAAGSVEQAMPSFIECTSRAQPDGVALVDGRAVKQGEGGMIATCDHAFLLEDDLAVNLRYARVHLPQRRGIESRLATRLREAATQVL